MKYNNYIFPVSDYEHSGDLDWAKAELKRDFPKIKNVKGFEERDYEAEEDDDDEPIYKGYIQFDAPEEYADRLDNYDL